MTSPHRHSASPHPPHHHHQTPNATESSSPINNNNNPGTNTFTSPQHLSTRLYSETLLRYQSESILQSQKQHVNQLRESTKIQVQKLQDLLLESQQREEMLLRENQQYKARFIASWCQKRDWREMNRVFGKWRRWTLEERERKWEQKLQQMKSFWTWRGMAMGAEKSKKNHGSSHTNTQHLKALREFVAQVSNERSMRWAWKLWKDQTFSTQSNGNAQRQKLRTIRRTPLGNNSENNSRHHSSRKHHDATSISLDSSSAELQKSMNGNGVIHSPIRRDREESQRAAPKIPSLNLDAAYETGEEDDTSEQTNEFGPVHNHSPTDEGILSEDNVHTVTVDLREVEAGRSYISSFTELDYISPRNMSHTGNGSQSNGGRVSSGFQEEQFSAHEVPTPKSPRRARLIARQQNMVDRLSKPRRVQERVHSIHASQWKESPSSEKTYSGSLSARRSSSRKKQRSGSKKRSSSVKKQRKRATSAHASPLHTPRSNRYASTMRISDAHDAAANSPTRDCQLDYKQKTLFGADYASPPKKPRLTEQDKKRIREILSSERR